MNLTNRRVFMMTLAAGTSALATAAMAQAKLDEKEPTAAALGYVTDSAKADKKKYAKHDVAQKCSNCQLFQGKAGAAEGGCPLFAGKSVAANGWCASWVKKA